ncbi:MAG: gamma-glutamylcyclotransferase [Variovorax sp.]|nr:gamma-glutamylcyclotransferase [Variovorax sp.]
MPQPGPTARHVFVYGTLRRGGSNDISRFSPPPERVGDGEIAGTLFDLGAYPGAVLGGQTRIKGEIYRIAPALEVQLDALEEVKPDGSGEYIRREVVVVVAGRSIGCLVYEIHPARIEGNPVIESGDWMSRA